MVSKGDVTELKSLSNPPQHVKQVLTATVTLLGEENAEDYRYVKRALGDSTFLQSLAKIDVGSIPPEVAAKARGYIDGISEDQIRNVSKAACSLFRWIHEILAAVEKRTSDPSATAKPQA
ncbi:dynein heavy chain 6, axonemal-like [Pecten maximus]|uniref:dynein heavy chain 6, axonemal-like n=1 Tax=Pecten maximus TaxID=6579 RepID=UPI0014581856|nr:dynein heavy chain 6, axonemal-like [Pecten maximus]